MDRIRRTTTGPKLAGVVVVIALLLDGCSATQISANSPSDSSAGSATQPSPTPLSVPTPSAITIEGTPAASVTAGTEYSFRPTVSDSTTAITFSIAGQPDWASFSPTTGALTGTPSGADVGTTGSIAVTANNGGSSASLAPFTIQVIAAVAGSPPGTTGSATLSWSAPTQNTDGSPITGLAGYHVYYGTDETDLSQTIDLAGATSTSVVVEGLVPGTYYFTVVAYNTVGADSADSNVALQTI